MTSSREARVFGEPLPLDMVVPAEPTVPAASQLSLLGEPVPVRVPAELWRSWLSDERVVARYQAKVYQGADLRTCWRWSRGISSTGHATFRAASLPGRSRRGTVPAHLFGYQLAHGVLPRLGWGGELDPIICHTCDEAACQNVAHMRVGTQAENRAEWKARRRNPASPLADLRGAAGRARAIAAAIREGQAAGETAELIDARTAVAAQAGMPATLW